MAGSFFDKLKQGLGLGGGKATAAPKKFTTSLNFIPINETIQDEGNAAISWNLGDLGTLTSHTAYREQSDLNSYDLDGTPRYPTQATAFNGGLDGIAYAAIGFNRRHTFVQQLDYSGQFGPLLLLSGVLYYDDRLKLVTAPNNSLPDTNPTLSNTDFKTKAWAVYIDETYNIRDKLFIQAGIRYNYDHKSLAVTQWDVNGNLVGANSTSAAAAPGSTTCFVGGGGACPGDPPRGADPDGPGPLLPPVTCNQDKYKHVTGKAWTPHIVLRYNLSRGTNVYASWSRGFKAATINSGSPFNVLKPETVSAWEVGIKTARRGFRGRRRCSCTITRITRSALSTVQRRSSATRAAPRSTASTCR
jgi:outer membrane receptor protein involved in Fe transport